MGEAEDGNTGSINELIGKKGRTITRLNPTGIIEIEGRQYEAHAEINYIEKDQSVLVCSADNFKIDVKECNRNWIHVTAIELNKFKTR